MVATQLPFELLEVKLAVPLTRPGTVAKADVIARLCAASVPFATVVASAGYGKTTLLARWAEADPRPFAWVVRAAGRGPRGRSRWLHTRRRVGAPAPP